jgi:thiol-disulfide isomerase/thioredoxin
MEEEKSDSIKIKIPAIPKVNTEVFRGNPWVLSTIVLALLVLMYLFSSFNGITGNVISSSDAGDIVTEFLNSQFVGDVEILGIEYLESGFYQIQLAVEGQLAELYVTRDGKNIVQGIIPVSDFFGGDDEEVSRLTDIQGSSFQATGDEVCTNEEGKPYVILFSTTWCPHCTWIKETFDSLAGEDFASEISLQHWELDTGDNTLTSKVETEVPSDLLAMYNNYNPQGSIPTYVFGCQYSRQGNGYESQDDLEAEFADFELIINKLIE